jgi:nucleoid DNA-binding protein
MTVTKDDIVRGISLETGFTRRDTSVIISGFMEAISNALEQGNRIELRGFGVFKTKKRRKRLARNPRTGKPISLDERFVPVFKPSKILKQRIKKEV